MPETVPGRTRINFAQSAKGVWQIEVTAEYSTPAESDNAMRDALERAHKIAADRGMPLATA